MSERRELGHALEPLEAVREKILSHVEPVNSERVPLERAHGRVLRAEIVASEHVPPFDNSAMDGFAVRSQDIATASPEASRTLPVIARVQAGDAGDIDLSAEAAIRIMTGAPLPSGADAVVAHELTEFTETAVTFTAPARKGQNIRRRGADLSPGDRPLTSGVVLQAPQLAVAGVLGAGEVDVTRQARIAILSPGDELVPVGESPGPGKIRNSNAHSLSGMIREAACEPIDLGIVPDRPEAIRHAIRRGIELGADAFVSTGGVSAGDFDFVRDVVAEDGDPGLVFKVAMRPGKPLVFGLLDDRPFFGLPGNPAASIISFEVFVRPALRKLRGDASCETLTFPVRFPFEYRYKSGRTFLLRTRIEPDSSGDASFRVCEPGAQDSSFLGSLVRANAVVELPPDRDIVEVGETRPAFWLSSHHR